jgi:hypothetical protein
MKRIDIEQCDEVFTWFESEHGMFLSERQINLGFQQLFNCRIIYESFEEDGEKFSIPTFLEFNNDEDYFMFTCKFGIDS